MAWDTFHVLFDCGGPTRRWVTSNSYGRYVCTYVGNDFSKLSTYAVYYQLLFTRTLHLNVTISMTRQLCSSHQTRQVWLKSQIRTTNKFSAFVKNVYLFNLNFPHRFYIRMEWFILYVSWEVFHKWARSDGDIPLRKPINLDTLDWVTNNLDRTFKRVRTITTINNYQLQTQCVIGFQP